MSKEVIIDNEYKGRRYVVVKIGGNVFFKDYCNGYIEVSDEEKEDTLDKYDVVSDEITFHGSLIDLEDFDNKDMLFIGFDTVHFRNMNNPESQTPEYVEKVCKKIIEEVELWKTKQK